MRALAASARVGRLGTVAAEGTPHLVPICFALVVDVAYSAVDHKPKRGLRLRRLANVQATGHACLLLDEYDEDWSRLWWVRLDGRGRLVGDTTAERSAAVDALVEKYPQYAERRPDGQVLAVDITAWSGWSAG